MFVSTMSIYILCDSDQINSFSTRFIDVLFYTLDLSEYQTIGSGTCLILAKVLCAFNLLALLLLEQLLDSVLGVRRLQPDAATVRVVYNGVRVAGGWRVGNPGGEGLPERRGRA